ncbi:MAG TPA: hypothetical protein VFZ76_01245 [Anaerolineales bacterium]
MPNLSLNRLGFSTKTVPLALMAVGLAGYGWLIPFLGLYVDDWHHIYFGHSAGGPGLWDLFLYDSRPFAAPFYALAFSIIGFKPLHWHIFAFILRGTTVVFTWIYLGDIWPRYKREVTWVTLLFAIYPLFKQQALSVAYSLHWLGFLFFSTSIWAMVQSIRKSRYFWAFVPLSILTGGLHLILLEYFVGLELIRPVILAILVLESNASFAGRIRRVVKLWWPYGILLISYVIYRLYFIPRPEAGFERNAPILIYDFLDAPFPTLVHFLESGLQDTIAILYSVWFNVINPDVFDISQSDNLIVLALTLLVAISFFIYLKNLRMEPGQDLEVGKSWHTTAIFVGLLLTVLGALPAWVTDQFVTTDNPLWSDRYGLASMLGASLVIVAFLELVVGNPSHRLAILATLLAFSVGWQVHTTNEYRRSWIKQSQFYWQLYWRAPYIEAGTAFLSSGEILSHMTEVSTSFALSTLYPPQADPLSQDYWFFSLTRRFDDQREELIQGMRFTYNRNFANFTGNSREGLVIFFEPEDYECLWVLRPQDTGIRALPEISRDVAVVSDLERIQIDSPLARPIPAEIFGSEPEHTWCYYFEKADLARQHEDWEQVVDLWNTAAASGLEPGNGVEYLPFIEAFAHSGDWQAAAGMTATANGLTRVMEPILCATWQAIERDTTPSEDRDSTLAEINARHCATADN